MATYVEQEEELKATQPIVDTVLKDVVAYVEVRSTNDNRTEAVRRELGKLGATVVKKFTNDVTHVIFKEGSNRTKTKAQKMGIHFVSVLWVESCRQNEAHVSERMYPAVVPKQKGPRLMFATKLKGLGLGDSGVVRTWHQISGWWSGERDGRSFSLQESRFAWFGPQKAKSMQPRDFEEDLANSAERLCRRKKRVDAVSRLCASETTPYSSPRSPMILVQDTQPRSPEDGYILTPVRLTIPDTPPSMREKMKQLLLAKQGADSDPGEDMDNDGDGAFGETDPLQRKLFKSSAVSCEFSSPGSPSNSSVFLSDPGDATIEEIPHTTSDTSITEDILNIASKINATMSHQAGRYSNVNSPSLDSTMDRVASHHARRYSNINSPLLHSTMEKVTSPRAKRFSNIHTPSQDSAINKVSIHLAGRYSNIHTPLRGATPENLASPQSVLLAHPVNTLETDEISPVLRLSNESDIAENTAETVESEQVVKETKGSRRKTRGSSVSFRKGEKLVQRRNPRQSSAQPPVIVLGDEVANKDGGFETSSIAASESSGVGVNSVFCIGCSSSKLSADENPIPKAIENENELCLNVYPKSNECEKGENSIDSNSDSVKSSRMTGRKDDSSMVLDHSKNLAWSSVKPRSPLTVDIDISSPNDAGTNIKIQVKKSRRTSCRLKGLQEESQRTKDNNMENNSHSKENVAKGDKLKERTIARNYTNETESTLTKVKAKPTLKKKLLSLTDLNDQHSVLVEPTKCSQVQRKQLIEDCVNPKKGKKQKAKEINDITKTNGRRSKSRKRKSNSSGDSTDEAVSKPKQRETSTSFETGENRLPATQKKNDNILVNDSTVEDKDLTVSQRNSTHLQDLTTQLNLTRDNSLMCSARERALSHSMSMAYTDTTLPSFLQPRRESIDEFSATQKRKKVVKKSVLATVKENKPCDSQISMNDVSSRLSLMKFIETTTHRKNIRPSIVMTSLHSHEQDVVIAIVKKLGGFVISESVNETTTHVICGESRRTLNVLQCLARGIWLLGKEWIIKSLEEGQWIPEQEFECLDHFPTCKVVREEREACIGIYRQGWLMSIGPIYVSGRASPPRPQLVQLIKLCGGQVTGTLNKAKVYVGADLHPDIMCVKTQWLLDSITEHQLLALEPYSLDRPKRESSPVY